MDHVLKTLMEAVVYFSDPDRTLKSVIALRWPDGVHCPTCGRTDVRFISTRRLWECKEKHTKRQFSAKVGTIFEDSALGLDKWFVAIWAIANCKNGISSYELARHIGVTQKTGWFMLHRIRLAMQIGSFTKMSGTVEADETFIGGIVGNMHKVKREKLPSKGMGQVTIKEVVVGVLQRTSEQESNRVRVRHVKDANKKNVQAIVREFAEVNSYLMTDSAMMYRSLGQEYRHQYVNHAIEHVRGSIHSNGIENFWSLLKCTIKGTYVSVAPIHLARYLDEQTFRFNERKGCDYDRFANVVRSIVGRRLTYKELTGYGENAA